MTSPLPPGSVIRWRVHDATGGAGSSWSAQTARNAGDVYVFHREGARWLKTSFHESGQWHFAITREGQELNPDVPPYMGVLKNREEIAAGWTHAMRITVARSELRQGYVEAAQPRPLIEVPVHPDFEAVAVDLFLGAASAAPIQIENGFLIAQLRRGDGGLAVVVARPMNLEAPLHVSLAGQIAQARDGMRTTGWDGSTPTRLVIIGADQSFLRQIEIAADPD